MARTRLYVISLIWMLFIQSSSFAAAPERKLLTPRGEITSLAAVVCLGALVLMAETGLFKVTTPTDRHYTFARVGEVRLIGKMDRSFVSPVLTFQPMDPSHRSRVAKLLAADLAMYPKAVLEESLDRVYVGEDVRLGTNKITGAENPTSRSIVVTATKDKTSLRRNFHHEMAHKLQRVYGHLFDTNAWNALNPKGFSYVKSSEQFIKEMKSSRRHITPEEQESLLQAGFVSLYSKTTMGEDLATLYTEMIIGDPKFWAAARRSPVLMAKVDLVIAFLNRIHPELTRAYYQDPDNPQREEPRRGSRTTSFRGHEIKY